MLENNNNQFLSKIKTEIKTKINHEQNNIKEITKKQEELFRTKEGYNNFYEDLKRFFIESMQDFTVNEEDLPKYFKSNINETYRRYAQIKVDATNEIKQLNDYMAHCEKEIKANNQSLKFYRSQYFDSDLFNDCLPLVDIYEKKISLFEKNIRLTEETMESLEKIADKLKEWE